MSKTAEIQKYCNNAVVTGTFFEIFMAVSGTRGSALCLTG